MIIKCVVLATIIFLLVLCSQLYDENKSGDLVNDSNKVYFSKESFDLGEISKLLNDLKAWHIENNQNFLPALNPGLSNVDLLKYEEKLGYKLPEELKALYNWHNGSNQEFSLFWYHRFVSLDEAISLVAEATEQYKWENSWLPLFEFENEYIFVKLDVNFNGTIPIFLAFPYAEHMQYFSSLTALLKTSVDILNKPGLVTIEEETGALLVEDTEKIKAIYNTNNPDLVFPYR